jgi:hypothetical protein
MDEKDKLVSAQKEIARLKARIENLEERIDIENKIYQRLENGICDRDGNRLFKVSITFWDTCGHGHSSITCKDILVAKLVEQGLKSLFKGKVAVETTTKTELYTDDCTWNYV